MSNINTCLKEMIQQHFQAFIIHSTMQYIYVRLYFKNNYFPSPVLKKQAKQLLLKSDEDETILKYITMANILFI